MGTFFTNIHVKSDNQKAVKDTLIKSDAVPAFVSKPENGWISVYAYETESQDEEAMKRICSALSEGTKSGVIGTTNHDSDIFLYVLAENGVVVDEYNSCPSYFEGGDDPPSGGDAQRLIKYCVAGTELAELETILRGGGLNLSLDSHMDPKKAAKAMKNTLVKNSPWWAKPVVWSAVTLMQMKGENGSSSSFSQLLQGLPGQDYLWCADKISGELSTKLGISDDNFCNGFNFIEETGSNKYTVVGDLNDKREREPTQEETAKLNEMVAENKCPLQERPSLPLFFSSFKPLFDATTKPDEFKSLCIENGFSAKENKINMLGLGESPIWWNMTLTKDEMIYRKFQFVAVAKGGKLHCASGELEQFEEMVGKPHVDQVFDYALKVAQEVFGPPEVAAQDECGHKYAFWKGSRALIFLLHGPGSDIDPRSVIQLWWEPWTHNTPPAIKGCLQTWLESRHPDIF